MRKLAKSMYPTSGETTAWSGAGTWSYERMPLEDWVLERAGCFQAILEVSFRQGGARLLTRQSMPLSSTHGATCSRKETACAGRCVEHVLMNVICHSVCVGGLGSDDISSHLADTLATFMSHGVR